MLLSPREYKGRNSKESEECNQQMLPSLTKYVCMQPSHVSWVIWWNYKNLSNFSSQNLQTCQFHNRHSVNHCFEACCNLTTRSIWGWEAGNKSGRADKKTGRINIDWVNGISCCSKIQVSCGNVEVFDESQT